MNPKTEYVSLASQIGDSCMATDFIIDVDDGIVAGSSHAGFCAFLFNGCLMIKESINLPENLGKIWAGDALVKSTWARFTSLYEETSSGQLFRCDNWRCFSNCARLITYVNAQYFNHVIYLASVMISFSY